MRGTHVDILLANLERDFDPGDWIFMSPAEAAAELREISGQDFGEDAERWITWFQRHRPDLIFAYEYRETYAGTGGLVGGVLGILIVGVAVRYTGLSTASEDGRLWVSVAVVSVAWGIGLLIGSRWRRAP